MNDQIRQGETLLLGNRIKDPIEENVQLFYNHFGRYFYAAQALKISDQDIVVDASCGCGYGSAGLARKAKRVYGLDVNKVYLEIAKAHLQLPNLTFLTYEELDYWYQDGGKGQVDKVICIETFEHIPRDQSNDFLSRLVRYLTDSGSMFLTTPLGNNGPSEYNPFHRFEPSIDVLHSMLSKHFGNVQLEVDTFVNSFGHKSEFCYATLRNKKGTT